MNTEPCIMDHVKQYACEFMKRYYPDEAQTFDIAWETFTQALQSGAVARGKRPAARDLRGPTVRGLQGPPARVGKHDVIVAPGVIHAFYLLFTMVNQKEHRGTQNLRQEMLDLLVQREVSTELSMEIIDFFMENMNQKSSP